MRKQYVFYGKGKIRLASFLHIGGEDEASLNLVTDGGGQYILPATSISGSVKAYFRKKSFDTEHYLGWADEELGSCTDSKIYYYDSVCSHVRLEERNGIRMDAAHGVVEENGLFKQYFIGQGMETDICFQALLDSEAECNDVQLFYKELFSGIQEGSLAFGAMKNNGAGIFQVIGAGSMLLNLSDKKELLLYLSGVNNVMRMLSLEPWGKKDNEQPANLSAEKGITEFELTAEIPDGLIIKSGEVSPRIRVGTDIRKVNAVNVTKEIDGSSCYYIPGTTIKGTVRGYAQKVCNTFGIPEEVMVQIFGGTPDRKVNRGYVKAHDVLVSQPQTTVYNRIKIDRWLGSVIKGAKMEQEVISTQNGSTIRIRVVTEEAENQNSKLMNALVYLALRDIGLGLVTIGSGSSVGLGRLKGKELRIGNYKAKFENRQIVFNEKDPASVPLKAIVEEWLQEVACYAN